MIKNLPVHCSTESTEWALSIPPAERRWHRKQGWLFSGCRISLSLFTLSLSSRPALSLWKPLPVLHTAVQPLHKSNKEEIIHTVRRGAPREAFSPEQMGAFTLLSGGHYSLSGSLWPHFSPPPNPSRCTPLKKKKNHIVRPKCTSFSWVTPQQSQTETEKSGVAWPVETPSVGSSCPPTTGSLL